jgi:hypothetical protein
MNITQIGFKSFRLLERADWLQTGMNSDQDECLGCKLDIGTTHANKTQKLSKKENCLARGINCKFCDFRTGFM